MSITYYPLTHSQKMLHQSRKEFQTAQVLTIGVCVAVKSRLDFTSLSQCIQEEIKRFQCLRTYFTPPDFLGNVKQYLVPQLDIKIPHMDFRKKDSHVIKEQMTAWSSVGFEQPDAPLCRFTMVSLPHGYDGLYLCVDHRILDSNGLIYLMKDLFELYCHYHYHTPRPRVPASYETVLQKDLIQQEHALQNQKDARFWRQLLSQGEPVYTDVLGGFGISGYGSRLETGIDGDMEVLSLDMKSSRLLTSYCKRHSVSMTNLLLMGMRTCISGRNGGQPDISLKNYVSRRSLATLKSSGGCRIHCYPCRTVIPAHARFLDGIRQIQSRQNNIYRHCQFDPAKVSSMMEEHYQMPPFTTYEGAALTCQPLSLSSANPMLRHIPLKIDWFSSRADIQKLYLTVMERPNRLGLNFYFKYQTALLSAGDVRLFYQDLVETLMMGVSDEDTRVNQILSALF